MVGVSEPGHRLPQLCHQLSAVVQQPAQHSPGQMEGGIELDLRTSQKNETRSSGGLVDPKGEVLRGPPNLSERDAGGWRRTLCRFQVLQKCPDAAVTRRSLRNAKVLLPHVPHVLLETDAPLARQSPGVTGRRQL